MKTRWMKTTAAVALVCVLAVSAAAQDENEAGRRPRGQNRGGRAMNAGMLVAPLLQGVAAMPDAEQAIKTYQEQVGETERALMQLRRTIMQEVAQAREAGKDEAAIDAVIDGYKNQLTPLIDKVTEARIALLDGLTAIAKANPVDAAAATTDQMLEHFKRAARFGGRRRGGRPGRNGAGQDGNNNRAPEPGVTF